MDNLSFRIPHVKVDTTKLKATLIGLGINVTSKTVVKQGCELVMFSMPVGPHKCRWLFRINLTDNTIACSGGVTKTFFGHNVWVFKNEATQLATIMGIVRDALLKIDGMTLECTDSYAFLIERVELTNHYVLPNDVSLAEALGKIDLLFLTLFPRSYSKPEGVDNVNPGTIRFGSTKGSRVICAYDPLSKFQAKPSSLPMLLWVSLLASCAGKLAVDLALSERELHPYGLTTLEGWENGRKVEYLVALRYVKLGLSVEFEASNEHFKPRDVQIFNPAFVSHARHWFSAGAKGAPPQPGSGAANRFKQYMLTYGFCTDVTYAQHKFLVHGLHDVFVPESSAELPPELKRNQTLFGEWWLADHQLSMPNFIK